MSLFAPIANASGPVKAAGLVAGGAGLASVVGFAFITRNPMILVWAGLGVLLVVLLLIAYFQILKLRDSKKANPFFSSIKSSGRGKVGLSDPGEIARVDEIRSKFEEGIETFKSAGKDLYSIPWYLVVGPPASGKTEAIRHSNVGFPPNLQDKLQGVGGTVNMHWWFTNQSVIIDTAGRVFMEQNQEWAEFLKLLRKHRSQVPINGMMLVMGVDTLITETAEQIEAKATEIAKALDLIQRTLDVRFPVYVLITKCDLLNGFREFFEHLDDPQLQHQMLGWSNPDELDQAFRPELVEEHLAEVRDRLTRRRMGLLRQTEPSRDALDAKASRIDDVDALYALPESIGKIGPRLRRYLELIFTAAEWSPKPLFLRGIYFTSSMQEGSELDQDLAEAIGVPVESIPAGPVWEKQRSYFLRDVFTMKVFKERGLVTRASNVRQQQRRRRASLLGSGVAVAAALTLVTLFAANSFEKAIGGAQRDWKELANSIGDDPNSSKLPWLARADRAQATSLSIYVDEPSDGEESSDATDPRDLAVATARLASAPIEVSGVFKPVAIFAGDPGAKAREAHVDALATFALVPAYESFFRRIEAERDQRAAKQADPSLDFEPESVVWQDAAFAALGEAIRLRVEAMGKSPRGSVRAGWPNEQLESLFRFASYVVRSDVDGGESTDVSDPSVVVHDPTIDGEAYERLLASENGGLDRLAEVVAFTFAPEPDGFGASWPPDNLKAYAASDRYGETLALAVASLEEASANQASARAADPELTDEEIAAQLAAADRFEKIQRFSAALELALRARNDVRAIALEASEVSTEAQYDEFLRRWSSTYGRLAAEYRVMRAAYEALDLIPTSVELSLQNDIETAATGRKDALTARYDALIDQLPAGLIGGDLIESNRPSFLGGGGSSALSGDEFGRMEATLEALKKTELASVDEQADLMVTTRLTILKQAMTPGPGATEASFMEELAAYAQVDDMLRREAPAIGADAAPGAVASAIAGVERDADVTITRGIKRLVGADADPNEDPLARVVRLAQRRQAAGVVIGYLAVAPDNISEIEELVAERSTANPTPVEPLPLTPLERDPEARIERRYDLGAGTEQLRDWVAVKTLVDSDEGSLLGVADIRSGNAFVRKSTAFESYRKALSAWWLSPAGDFRGRIAIAGTESMPDWPAFNRALVNAEYAGDINRRVRNLWRDVLGRFNADTTASLVHAQYVEDVNVLITQLRLLDGDAEAVDALARDCDRTLRTWKALGGDVEDARSVVLDHLDPDAELIASDLYAGSSLLVDYWGGLVRHGFRLVRGDLDRNARRAKAWFESHDDKFPFCVGRDVETASSDEVAEAKNFIRDIEAIYSFVRADLSIDDLQINQDLPKTAKDALVEEINKLRGEGVLNDDERAWFTHAIGVLGLFEEDGSMVVSVEPNVSHNDKLEQDSKPEALENENATRALAASRFVEFKRNNRTIGQAAITLAGLEGANKRVFLSENTLRLPPERLTLEFTTTPGGPVQRIATIGGEDGAYRLLRLAADARMSRRDADGEDADKRRVSVAVLDDDREVYYWLDVVFKNDVPLPESWSDCDGGNDR